MKAFFFPILIILIMTVLLVYPQAVAAKIGDPLPNLTNQQQTAFYEGKAEFLTIETSSGGLGPVFNDTSCAGCHNSGATGGGSGTQLETRVGRVEYGIFDPLTNAGGELIQTFGIYGFGNISIFNGEHIPPNANVFARRRTIPLFGDGLIDATSDSTFMALAVSQPKDVRGRVNIVYNISTKSFSVGKFGWKAQVPSLFQFSGDAYLNEMGITNPQFPTENSPQGDLKLLVFYDTVPDPEDNGSDVQAFTEFMQLLAPPSRGPITPQVLKGDKIFTEFGCDQCHIRDIQTSSNPVEALSNILYHPFSDMLLHDMGTLGDGIPDQGIANGREMRTQPLWGLRYQDPNSLLHDGRAHSLYEAILLHDGQGKSARDAFAKANPKKQQYLLDFLNSL